MANLLRFQRDGKNGATIFCCVCGYGSFRQDQILWQELIDEWQLSAEETRLINIQQGFACERCGENLRVMTLAHAMMQELPSLGQKTFCRWVRTPRARRLRVLEVNQVGGLTRFLSYLPRHRLQLYPELDMQDMKNIPDNSYDVVIHSETLEHIPNSISALQECYRVLKKNGRLIYTVPTLVHRMTRSRAGLTPSFHGRFDTRDQDHLVQREYGADFWLEPLESQFGFVTIYSIAPPFSFAIVARKNCYKNNLHTDLLKDKFTS